jgi:hypothetical protein
MDQAICKLSRTSFTFQHKTVLLSYAVGATLGTAIAAVLMELMVR